MKYLFLFILLCTGLFGGNEFTASTTSVTEILSNGATYDNSQSELKLEELLKFYIGYTEYEGKTILITVDIQDLGSSKEEAQFHYTLNSLEGREDGIGKIYLAQGIIEFNDHLTGKIFRDNEQKIIIESLRDEGLTYWKIKEK